MDRTFMFFDNNTKMKKNKKAYNHNTSVYLNNNNNHNNKQYTHSRNCSNHSNYSNHSRSNSSKNNYNNYQHVKNSARLRAKLELNNLQMNNQKPVISQKQKQIREAIEYRYVRSKMNAYHYYPYNPNTGNTQRKSARKSIDSCQMEQYKNLKNLRIINLKQYHEKNDQKIKNQSKNTSKDSKNINKDFKTTKFTMKFKLKQNKSTIFKTQGSQPISKSNQKNKYFTKYLDRTGSQLSKKKQEWKFISIQLKGQSSSSKNGNSKLMKEQMKINSHRTLNIQRNHSNKSKIKIKSTDKYWDNIPKLKQLQKLNRKYKF